jgi:hypothetical protein
MVVKVYISLTSGLKEVSGNFVKDELKNGSFLGSRHRPGMFNWVKIELKVLWLSHCVWITMPMTHWRSQFSDIPATYLGTGSDVCISEWERHSQSKKNVYIREENFFFLFLFPSGYIWEWCRWCEETNKLLFKRVSNNPNVTASLPLFGRLISIIQFNNRNAFTFWLLATMKWIIEDFKESRILSDVNVMAIQ